MPDFHAAILANNLQSLAKTASGTLAAPVRKHAVAKARRIAVDAATLKAGGGDASVLGDVIGRATALADRLEGKPPTAAPQLAPFVMPTASAPQGNAAAVVQAAATHVAAPPPPPPKVDHSAGWKRAIADANGGSVPDVAPATSTAAAGWRKAIDAATGRNL
jgi:hypothetical protein